MATVTLADMRRIVRHHADIETTAPTTAEVDDDELDGYINPGLGCFHDLMLEIQRHEWPITPLKQLEATGDGDTERWQLTNIVQHVVMVRVRENGTDWFNLPDWQHEERSDYLSSTRRSLPYAYRDIGGEIEILPAVRSGSDIQICYWPEFEPLTQASSSFKCPRGWEEWPAWLATIDVLTKQDRATDAAKEKFSFHDRRIRALAGRRAGRLRIVDRWVDRASRIPWMPNVRRLYRDS